MRRTQIGQGLVDVAAVAVGEGVVGHHSFDPGDAHGGEVGRRPPQEAGAGLGGLVVVDLAVGQAGVVIDHGGDVVIADALLAVGVARGAAVGAPPAAVGDLAQLLHIHVDQLPGPGTLIAHGDRKSTRLNSSHVAISYAVFCLINI